jgi:hypothetical protein
MRHSLHRLTAAVLLLAGVRGSSFAQAPQPLRDGFWIGFGVGVGSLGCDGCRNDLGGQPTVNFRLGGTINQHLLIGGQVDAWSKSDGGTTLSFGNVTATVYYYPAADGGFFLLGGLGGSSLQLESGPFKGETNGPGFTAGLGYDWRVGKSFALTPYITLLEGHFDGGNAHVAHVGLGFTWP